MHRLIAAFLLLASAALPAGAQRTWYVEAWGAPSGAGTPASPFSSIQQAVSVASGGDTVLVGPGVYSESVDLLGKDVTVRGRAGPNATTIDAGGVGRGVLFKDGSDNALLEGFTVTGGHAAFTGASYSNYGGGIFCWNSSPTISRCRITANTADDNGGGIACFLASPTIVACVIDTNTAPGGGGISVRDASAPVISSCAVWNNAAIEVGGVLSIWFADTTLMNCTVVGNTAATQTGGVQAQLDATFDMVNCIVWDNQPLQVTQATNGVVTAMHSCVQGGFPGAGNIASDPLLADPTSGDLHLTWGSPCRDAGTSSTSLPATDHEGHARSFGPAPDIGADEWPCTQPTCLTTSLPLQIGGVVGCRLAAIPIAPLYVLVDTATGSIPLGAYGQSQLAFSPGLFPLAAWTSTFGAAPGTPTTDAQGLWRLDLPLPDAPQLATVTLFAEAYVVDPFAPNGLFRQSNLLTVTFQ